MLYRHVFDEISTEFRGILRVFVNFTAPLMLEISEALYLWAVSFTFYKLATKNLYLATTFLLLVAKRRPEVFFNFEPWSCTTKCGIFVRLANLFLALLRLTLIIAQSHGNLIQNCWICPSPIPFSAVYFDFMKNKIKEFLKS